MALSSLSNRFVWTWPRSLAALALAASAATAQQADLVVGGVDAGNVTGNWQSLSIGGSVDVTVKNVGLGAASSAFDLVLFEDRNANGAYDAGTDVVLGSQAVAPLGALGSNLETVSVSGTVTFRGNLIYAFVDASNVIGETDEANNVGNSGDTCSFQPPPGLVQPQLEWSWNSSLVQPTALNVMMTPSVVDLDGDGIPEVIFASTASTGGGLVEVGYLRALHGNGGAEYFTVNDPTLLVNTASSIAVGDIDNDGRPEIIACDNSGARLICFEHDGTFKWRSPALEQINWGAPAIADLDGDGTPEIVIGRQVLDAAGNILWSGTGGHGGDNVGPMSIVADVDNDGSPDIVAGNTIYSASGAILYQNLSLPDALPAVANLDSDPQAEIVTVIGGVVRVLELGPGASLTQVASIAIPGGGTGGPPTIADYDGDGVREIGVAGASRYTVFEYDPTTHALSVKWAAVTQDSSSNRTGSSVFDFNGDGAAEVVYRDELFLRVYNGTDGTVLFQVPMSSCTWYEYVLVADVDADGNAEIVACANNNCGFGPQRGIYVYGDVSDNWVATRRVWNEHSYHITNVDEDGGIPAHEPNNWLTPAGSPFNNYRQNTLSTVNPIAAPDVTASFLRATSSPTQTLTARIGNGGGVLVGIGLPVAFYDGDPTSGGNLLGVAHTATQLDPGEFEDVTLTLGVAVPLDAWVVADDAGGLVGTQNECNETNNIHNASVALDLVCPADVIEAWSTGTPSQVDPAHTGLPTWVDSCDPSASPTYSDTYDPGVLPGEPEVIVTRTWRLADNCGNVLTCVQTITLLSPSGGGAMHLDALPEQCPNIVYVKHGGNSVFSLVGTGVVDVTQVDLSSLQLARTDGIGTVVSGFWRGFQDRATPFYGASGQCNTLGPDGVMDIAIEVSNAVLRRRMMLGSLAEGQHCQLALRGRLLNGTHFEARDIVVISQSVN